ncbi:putative serine/threonine-protein kinase fhkC [Leucoagaricus sp. SymC.cos]|nr:putative serine/threonine-protein kinase fhkC [Leucoagaricus sp. SymC.cos]
MDFENSEPLQETQQSQEPQTQSTQPASQQQDDLEKHLWGALIPCNPEIARVDLWKLQTTYRVGRNPTGNQIVFPGPKISNYHCQIAWDSNDSQDAVVTVLDLSSNGTWINNSKIGKQCTRVLREGNEIGFGSNQPQADGSQDYRFIFRLMSGSPPTDGVHAHYDFTSELGKGSFATVMKAIERSTGKWYAIKIITEKHNRPSDQSRFAFSREIDIMKRLKHPNICELKEVFYQDNGINLVLELVEGGDLLEYILRQGGLSEDRARQITYQICDALAYIHAQGVTHRDLKPENVLLTKDDPPLVKVADFGLAKAVRDDETMLRTMCGTPTYLAPEVVVQREGGGYTNRVDSWSVGVIVFSMLTNSSPFLEDERERDIRIRILSRQVDWAALDTVIVSPQARNFIECLLEQDPDRRMSLTDSLKHPWLRSYTPYYGDLKAYDTISSLDPQDFSMLTSMPGFDMNKSVTTNFNGLKLTSNYNAPGPSNLPARDLDSYEEQSWENVPDANSESNARGGVCESEGTAATSAMGKKRVHAELTPQQDEDESMAKVNEDNNNVGAGRMTRARARAQQQQQPVEEEDSFEVPGLTHTRRSGPPNKMARRK